MGCSRNSTNREVYSGDNYINEERSQGNNLTFCLKELEKEQTKPKVNRKKEIIKLEQT